MRKLAAGGVGFRNAIASNGLAETANGFTTIATGLTTSGPGIKHLGLIGEPLNLLSRELPTEREVDGLPEHRDVAPLMLRLFGAPKGRPRENLETARPAYSTPSKSVGSAEAEGSLPLSGSQWVSACLFSITYPNLLSL